MGGNNSRQGSGERIVPKDDEAVIEFTLQPKGLFSKPYIYPITFYQNNDTGTKQSVFDAFLPGLKREGTSITRIWIMVGKKYVVNPNLVNYMLTALKKSGILVKKPVLEVVSFKLSDEVQEILEKIMKSDQFYLYIDNVLQSSKSAWV